MDLNALEDFRLVATHGGFGKASRASGRSKATLSRRVADLEEALNIRLIERGIRSLKLSEAGQLLLNRRSEEHTSELQSLMRNSYAAFCTKKKTSTQHSN